MKSSNISQHYHNPPNQFTSYFGEQLVKHITYRLSEEQKQTTAESYMEEVLVCVDLLTLICEHYQLPLGIPIQHILGWLTRYTEIFEIMHQVDTSSIEKQSGSIRERYDIFKQTFAKLEEVAQNFPAQSSLRSIGRL